jgi:mevalonate kinase
MTENYYSNGKLLLTGEYLVLRGAEAMALPLKLGQSLQVQEKGLSGHIRWNSYYQEKTIFNGLFSINKKQFISSSDKLISNFLEKILTKIINVLSLEQYNSGLTINTFLDFPLYWGLGSSSSLISNLAQWLQLDPFGLNEQISEGSGYDIACAKSLQPIIYRKKGSDTEYKNIHFNPPYKDKLFFIYTGKKQNSREEIKNFLNKKNKGNNFIERIHSINKKILKSQTLAAFENAINDHELLISRILKQTPVQQRLFPDFPGTIKSLGAWGGDFILATWKYGKSELLEYFERHNMNTIFSWDELIKNKENAE